VAAQQIMFEGMTQANLTMFSGALSGMGTLASGALQAQNVAYRGRLQAHNIRTQGILDSQAIWSDAQWQASQLRQGGDQAFMNGILNAGASYVGYKIATMPPKSPTPTPPKMTHGVPSAGRAYRLSTQGSASSVAGNRQVSLLT
jgi:hypothetical protein